MNERGSAALETALSLPLLILIMIGGMAVLYLSFARVWLDRATYEASVCLATSSPSSACERRLFQSVESALPQGQIANVRLLRTNREVRAEAAFVIGERRLFRVESRLALPLLKTPSMKSAK